MDDDGLLLGGGVHRFALRLSVRIVLVANLAAALMQVGFWAADWLPSPLGQTLAITSMTTTVVAFPVCMVILLVIGQAIRSLTRSRDRFERLSTTDPLSGLQNRRAFMRHFEAAPPGSLLVLLDIDRFKRVNDTYGHPAGDEVIRGTATLLATAFAADVPVGRLGGEEFAVLLPPPQAGDRDGLLSRVDQARQAVAELRFTAAPGGITISAGVAEVTAAGRGREVLAAADRALYAAKRGGRNRVVAAWDRPLLGNHAA